MPRLRQVALDQAPPAIREVYAKIFGEGRDPVADPGTPTGTPGDWWTVFALVPDVLAHAMAGFAVFNDPRRKLEPVHRELGLLRTGWSVGSRFVFSQHSKFALAIGVAAEKIAAIPSWSTSSAFDDRERAVLAFVDDMIRADGRVPDETFACLQAALSDEAILELGYVVGAYRMYATLSRAFRTEYDDVPERVVEVPAPEGFEVSSLLALVARPEDG